MWRQNVFFFFRAFQKHSIISNAFEVSRVATSGSNVSGTVYRTYYIDYRSYVIFCLESKFHIEATFRNLERTAGHN